MTFKSFSAVCVKLPFKLSNILNAAPIHPAESAVKIYAPFEFGVILNTIKVIFGIKNGIKKQKMIRHTQTLFEFGSVRHSSAEDV